jgi:mannose-6-phosphate isomerase-like protein (cupin superfamily)
MKLDIITQTQENTDYRKVIATGADSQLVLMCLSPGEDIGEDVYPDVDQITTVVEGTGFLEMGNDSGLIQVGDLVFAPAGVKHNIVNNSPENDLKLYTIYAPPEYLDNEVISTQEELLEDEISDLDEMNADEFEE